MHSSKARMRPPSRNVELLCLQVPDPNFFLDNVIFGCMYLVWPVVVTIIIFMATMKMSWAPQENEDKYGFLALTPLIAALPMEP